MSKDNYYYNLRCPIIIKNVINANVRQQKNVQESVYQVRVEPGFRGREWPCAKEKSLKQK